MKKYYLLLLSLLFFEFHSVIFFSKFYHHTTTLSKNKTARKINRQDLPNNNLIYTTEESTAKNTSNSTKTKEIGRLSSLDTLYTSSGCLNPEFHCDSLHYTLGVDDTIDHLVLFAKVSLEDLFIVKIDLEDLDSGDSSYAVIVATEDQPTPKIYIITISRESYILNTCDIPL